MVQIRAIVSWGHVAAPIMASPDPSSCVNVQPPKLEGNYSTNSILLQAGITHHSQAPFTQPSNYDPTSVKTTAGVNSPHIIYPPPPPPPRTVPPYLIATYVPTVPQPPIFTLPSAQYMDYLDYIILGLFVLIILRKLCKCRVQRFASSPDFDICLEIKASRSLFLSNYTEGVW